METLTIKILCNRDGLPPVGDIVNVQKDIAQSWIELGLAEIQSGEQSTNEFDLDN